MRANITLTERLIEFGELRPSLKKYGDLSYSNMKRIEVLQARRESVNEEIDRGEWCPFGIFKTI